MPLWVREVIFIQSNLDHPSVWPKNLGRCSLLLLSFVRWQAKTLMGNLGCLLCTAKSLCTRNRVHMFVTSRDSGKERARKAKCWLKPQSLFWRPRVEAAVTRKHAGTWCTIPTDLIGWPPNVVTFSRVMIYRSVVRLQISMVQFRVFYTSSVTTKDHQTWSLFTCT